MFLIFNLTWYTIHRPRIFSMYGPRAITKNTSFKRKTLNSAIKVKHMLKLRLNLFSYYGAGSSSDYKVRSCTYFKDLVPVETRFAIWMQTHAKV